MSGQNYRQTSLCCRLQGQAEHVDEALPIVVRSGPAVLQAHSA